MKAGPLRFLWVTDPWNTLDHAGDTTLRLIEESLVLRIESWWCDVRSIRWDRDRVLLDACQVRMVYPSRRTHDFHLAPAMALRPDEFDQIHYRVDPPVDLGYIHPLQLLTLGTEMKANGHGRTEIVNAPHALLLSNEKTEGALLGDLMPPSVVSSQWTELSVFGHREGRTVLKPLHRCQSKGVELLDWRDSKGLGRARTLLEEATAGFTIPILLQRYLKGIEDGEQRLWFADGKLLASARKCPVRGEFRIDMDRGASLTKGKLTANERRAARRAGRRLKEKGIRLAAVDLIEGYVTDYNFTSPGLLVQMEALLKENLARRVLRALVKSP